MTVRCPSFLFPLTLIKSVCIKKSFRLTAAVLGGKPERSGVRCSSVSTRRRATVWASHRAGGWLLFPRMTLQKLVLMTDQNCKLNSPNHTHTQTDIQAFFFDSISAMISPQMTVDTKISLIETKWTPSLLGSCYSNSHCRCLGNP